MNTKKYGLSLALVMAILIMVPGQVFSEPEVVVNSEIEKAVLNEDWETVVDLCGPNKQLVSFPVLRAIKGHACIDLNRNNESLYLFLTVANDSARQAWKEWASGFAQRNPESPAAQYFKGDALARNGEWNLAIQVFDTALKLKPDFALALNARGVVYAYERRWDEALEDLEKACKIDTHLADAYGNLGSLLILMRASASDTALSLFEKALAISPDFALAFNGCGCIDYALVKWPEANQDFAKAGRKMNLPLFLANLRTLAVAAEQVQLPGLENSPLFRVTDFLDWETLRDSTANEDDILRAALGGYQLPETVDVNVIEKLNKVLNNPQFYEQIKRKIHLTNASHKLLALIDETGPYRGKKTVDLTDEQQGKIRLLNRMLIERAYPYLIAQHDQRDPGMQLTLKQGLVDQLDYKRSLKFDRLVAGQLRVDHLWRPMADLFETSGVPIVAGIGKQWNRHLDVTIRTNEIAFRDEWGIPLHAVRSRGVLVDLRRRHVDKGDWPVVNWFGLAYVSP